MTKSTILEILGTSKVIVNLKLRASISEALLFLNDTKNTGCFARIKTSSFLRFLCFFIFEMYIWSDNLFVVTKQGNIVKKVNQRKLNMRKIFVLSFFFIASAQAMYRVDMKKTYARDSQRRVCKTDHVTAPEFCSSSFRQDLRNITKVLSRS